MKPTPEQLKQLDDIILSAPPGFWPPSWGWIILGCLLLIILAALYYFLRQRRLKGWQIEALETLAAIEKRSRKTKEATKKAALLSELNQVLKRVALTCYNKDEISQLQGKAWLNFLDQSTQKRKATNVFRRGAGQILQFAPYMSRLDDKALQDLNWAELFSICEQWLKQQGAKKKRLNRGE